MCFKNLPIEFDERGQARLRAGVADPYAYQRNGHPEERVVHDAHSMATLFRGYEIILKGRDPRDAIFISSRACGVCGGVHSNASAEALEMAFGIHPPPMGVVARNLLLSLEYLYDHPLHLFLLAGPDYSEPAVRETNPELWAQAERTPARGAKTHGFKTVAEIMSAMAPLTGQ